MNRLAVLGVALLFVGFTTFAADTLSEPLAALQTKLHGKWQGTSPCDGNLIVEADGTYRREHYSPGNNVVSGKWTVRWDALPPTLVLTCETADRDSLIGKTQEVKLLSLDGESLACQYSTGESKRFIRAPK